MIQLGNINLEVKCNKCGSVNEVASSGQSIEKKTRIYKCLNCGNVIHVENSYFDYKWRLK